MWRQLDLAAQQKHLCPWMLKVYIWYKGETFVPASVRSLCQQHFDRKNTQCDEELYMCNNPACGATDCKLKRCARCLRVSYCSAKCQEVHWPVHKKDCKKTVKVKFGDGTSVKIETDDDSLVDGLKNAKKIIQKGNK